MPLLEEVTFFMVWFDPDLPVLCIHLNNTGPTARLTARCYRARVIKLLFGLHAYYLSGNGGGSVGRVVASITRDPWINSQHWQKIF